MTPLTAESTMDQLKHKLGRLNRARMRYNWRTGSGIFLNGGIETVTANAGYYWHGLRRDPNLPPYVIFQYTLAGWGHYVEEGTTRQITPGTLFVTTVPSDHFYYLPPDSAQWTFFWLTLHHPYLVERVIACRTRAGSVFRIDPGASLILRALRLFESLSHDTFRDRFGEEQAVFELLMEYERFLHHVQHPELGRERLLQEVRAHVLESLHRAIEVADVAAHYRMSRSHFSHFFKMTTGQSPAQFITQIRLEEAGRRLRDTELTLERIAQETGFADANHLCKVFRRHHDISPGAFRRQMRTIAAQLED